MGFREDAGAVCVLHTDCPRGRGQSRCLKDPLMTNRPCLVRPLPITDRYVARFVAMLPVVRKQARYAFRFQPSAARAERVDDAVAHAFVLFAYLVRRNRIALIHPTALTRYAIFRVRSGRPIGTPRCRRDLLSRLRRNRVGIPSIEVPA